MKESLHIQERFMGPDKFQDAHVPCFMDCLRVNKTGRNYGMCLWAKNSPGFVLIKPLPRISCFEHTAEDFLPLTNQISEEFHCVFVLESRQSATDN